MRTLLARTRYSLAALAAAAICFGCATRPSQVAPAPSAPLSPPEPFVRVAEVDSNRVELQIALRLLVPVRGKGPAIWLDGVAHVGERSYYEALQEHLNAASLVLYEGISSAPGTGTPAPPTPAEAPVTAAPATEPAASNDSRSALQNALASALGLEFQLDAIDYSQPNFQNCDLSVGELRELMLRQPAPGGTGRGSSRDLESLLELMQGNSLLSTVAQVTLRLLGASPKLQGLGRLALIDLIDQIQGDPERLGQAAPELKQLLQVLVQERNKKVVADLKQECQSRPPPASVAIFYGTAHMPDMQQRICRELSYRPARDVWLTAFAVDLKRSGITAGDRRLLDSLVASLFKAASTEAAH